MQPLSLDKFGEPLHTFPAFTASVANLQPTSRGHIRLKLGRSGRRAGDPAELSLDRRGPPRRRRIRSASTRRIVAQPALRRFHPVEYLPGEPVRGDDEASLAKAAGDIGTTIFHPVGTAKMGRDQRSAWRWSTSGCACSGSSACA